MLPYRAHPSGALTYASTFLLPPHRGQANTSSAKRDTTIIRDNVIESVRALKAQPGKNILTDGSSQLVHALLEHDLVDELHLLVYPLTLGSGKRVLPNGVHTTFSLKSAEVDPVFWTTP